MKIAVLIDNLAGEGFLCEWGLSFHIEYSGRRFLLDMGATDAYLENAEKLGNNVAEVDYAIVSHAHYDHTNGLASFLKANSKASIYLSPNAGENCYSGTGIFKKYIGMPKGVAAASMSRIIRQTGVSKICEGVFLIPHSTDGLEAFGRRNHQYIRKGMRFIPDNFSHEQTLVFKCPEGGLVILNSCSHSGPEIIVKEVLAAFPGETVRAYVGGLHLFRLSEQEIETVADGLATCGIRMLYTGHCTGEQAFNLLKSRFGEKIEQFHSGMEIEI